MTFCPFQTDISSPLLQDIELYLYSIISNDSPHIPQQTLILMTRTFESILNSRILSADSVKIDQSLLAVTFDLFLFFPLFANVHYPFNVMQEWVNYKKVDSLF